jgi:hypothetical protein
VTPELFPPPEAGFSYPKRLFVAWPLILTLQLFSSSFIQQTLNMYSVSCSVVERGDPRQSTCLARSSNPSTTKKKKKKKERKKEDNDTRTIETRPAYNSIGG